MKDLTPAGDSGGANRLVLFNKPYNVMCQFTDLAGRAKLADYISIKNIYPAGRLDYDSEGLVILTNLGYLQHLITDPRHKLPKTYWIQIEGEPDQQALKQLAQGVKLPDGLTLPAKVRQIATPELWPRIPSIRVRKNIPTTWLEITIIEGRNRQVRRMTAAVGYPTLRLIRQAIGPWQLGNLLPGQWQEVYCPKDQQELQELIRKTPR
ncbi:MAG: pseudouridine synthase [Acidobacteriota bacterium]